MKNINKTINAIHLLLTGLSFLFIAETALFNRNGYFILLSVLLFLVIQVLYFYLGSRNYINYFKNGNNIAQDVQQWKFANRQGVENIIKSIYLKLEKYKDELGVLNLDANVSDQNVQIFTQPIMSKMNVYLFTNESMACVKKYDNKEDYNILLLNGELSSDWAEDFDGVIYQKESTIYLMVKTKYISIKSKKLQFIYRFWANHYDNDFEVPLSFNSTYIMFFFRRIVNEIK